MYCVNFYSGSVDDGEAVSVVVSGRSQLQISIPDHEFANSSIPKEEYALQKIIATVKQRLQSEQSKASDFLNLDDSELMWRNPIQIQIYLM